jgi:2-dehydro-3-deoxyphosphogalactonate aldolase
MNWTEAFDELPLIAILRGIPSTEAVRVATLLCEAGFRLMEVPLNSPAPLDSIAKIRAALEGRALIGAGTVLNRDSVVQASSAGAQFIVAPNTDADVIAATKDLDLISVPAFSTPTEALVAIKAGADMLKLFPAEANSPPVLRSMRAVLPATIKILPVGGITPSNMQPYRDAGADGFGIGSALYRSGKAIDDIQASAASFITAWRGSAS